MKENDEQIIFDNTCTIKKKIAMMISVLDHLSNAIPEENINSRQLEDVVDGLLIEAQAIYEKIKEIFEHIDLP